MSVDVQKVTAVYSLENLLHTHLAQHCVKHSLLAAVLTNTILYIVYYSRVSQHLLVASRHAGGNKLCRHNCVVYGSGKRLLVRTYVRPYVICKMPTKQCFWDLYAPRS